MATEANYLIDTKIQSSSLSITSTTCRLAACSLDMDSKLMLQVSCLSCSKTYRYPAAQHAITGTFGQDRTERDNPHAHAHAAHCPLPRSNRGTYYWSGKYKRGKRMHARNYEGLNGKHVTCCWEKVMSSYLQRRCKHDIRIPRNICHWQNFAIGRQPSWGWGMEKERK